ncbi:hypothetical protein PV08_02145 [Exophiala spinifera]|uniref:Uncharacterized protein n=1 Tax=Exophiala spinifera TaxID=91928 RepID=A0A0D2BT37_9EURO|nr:uncharacterized protein PV08_02145 [Exophiala spinifera]KIW21565.1 hypothetical protein PV08_02145 [Exophiala spinifera]
MARDRNIQAAMLKQTLVESMVDDRDLAPDAAHAVAYRKGDNNVTGWAALPSEKGDADVSYNASLARAKSLSWLRATIDVVDSDLFRGEAAKFAIRIAADDITIEFHL